MSINNQDYNNQYKAIIQGLKEEHRVVYKEGEGFVALKRDQAKKLEQENTQDTITQLPRLEGKIKEFVENNRDKLTASQINDLNRALDTRADLLEGKKTGFFTSLLLSQADAKIIDERADQLRSIKTTVSTAAQQSRIPTNVPASTPGPSISSQPQPLPPPTPSTTPPKQPPLPSQPPSTTPQPPTPAPAGSPQKGLPPPPPGAAGMRPPGPALIPKSQKFAGEPDLPIYETNYKGKTQIELERDIQLLQNYIEKTTAAFKPIEQELEIYEKLVSEITTQTNEYYEPSRKSVEAIQKILPEMIEIWNENGGAELEIGDGKLALYTDKEYAEKDKNKPNNLSIANKLSFQVQVLYSKMKEEEQKIAQENDTTLQLIDANEAEVVEIEVEQKGTRPTITPKRQGMGIVSFSDAKRPLQLVSTTINKDQEGSETKKLATLKEKKTQLEKAKSGDIELKDYRKKITEKQKKIQVLEAHLKARQQAIKDLQQGKSPKETQQNVKAETRNPSTTEDAYNKIDAKIRHNLEISPANTIMDVVNKGTQIHRLPPPPT